MVERDPRSPSQLAQEKSPNIYLGDRINAQDINVLNQPRQTFEEIEQMAQDIAFKNLLNPLIVARLSTQKCREYVNTVNELWQTHHTIGELHPVLNGEGEEIYYVLLAGERRLRAFKQLLTVGCMNCQENYGQGPCIQRHKHFEDGKVDVRLAKNIDALDAIFLQSSENIHMRVPPDQEAHFYNNLLHSLRRKDSSYPLTKFAIDVGRNPDTIRTALKYCELPLEIQESVEAGHISYGIALEIARLKSALNLSENQLTEWAIIATAGRYNVPKFKELVQNHIRQEKSGQTMLDIYSETEELNFKNSKIKRVVYKESINMVWRYIEYFGIVIDLLEKGKLNTAESPFSMGSPLRVFRALIKRMKEVTPHLKNLLSEAELLDADNALETADDLMLQILEKQRKSFTVTIN